LQPSQPLISVFFKVPIVSLSQFDVLKYPNAGFLLVFEVTRIYHLFITVFIGPRDDAGSLHLFGLPVEVACVGECPAPIHLALLNFTLDQEFPLPLVNSCLEHIEYLLALIR
jgi:hypothetical protein